MKNHSNDRYLCYSFEMPNNIFNLEILLCYEDGETEI